MLTEESPLSQTLNPHTYIIFQSVFSYHDSMKMLRFKQLVFPSPRTFCALFALLNILDIFKVNFLYFAKFMFCYHHQSLSSPFLNLFLIHNYDTRASAHFRPHTYRANIKKYTIPFRGPKIWNVLPFSITSSLSLVQINIH